MPGKTALRLTKRSVEALFAEGRDSVFWDSNLPGFGVRVYRTGRRVYCVQTRGPAGPKHVTLGRHGEMTADAARRQAATVIDRIKRGEPPFPVAPEAEPTITDLAGRFLRAHVEVNCSANTRDSFGLIVRNHILPELGGLAVSAVERRHVVALHDSLSATPTQANRTLAVLSAMFRLAEAWDLVPPGHNPCRRVRRYRETPRERFLSRDEYRRLGRVLAEAEKDGSENPIAVAAIRLLLLTGCRKTEILSLQWDDVDRVAGELRLKESKAGARRVPLTPAIEAVLSGILSEDLGAGCDLAQLIAPQIGETSMCLHADRRAKDLPSNTSGRPMASKTYPRFRRARDNNSNAEVRNVEPEHRRAIRSS